MITVDELRGIRIFAPLPQEALEYLVGAVEDIHLVPGEYFAHEGDERALFVWSRAVPRSRRWSTARSA